MARAEPAGDWLDGCWRCGSEELEQADDGVSSALLPPSGPGRCLRARRGDSRERPRLLGVEGPRAVLAMHDRAGGREGRARAVRALPGGAHGRPALRDRRLVRSPSVRPLDRFFLIHPERRPARDERLDRLALQRTGEEEPLTQLASKLEQPVSCSLVSMPSATAWSSRIRDSWRIASDSAETSPLVGDAVDERLVDLQDVDREAPDVVQRRVAGPEVVDGEPNPELLQSLSRGDRQVDVGIMTLSVISSTQARGLSPVSRRIAATSVDEVGRPGAAWPRG